MTSGISVTRTFGVVVLLGFAMAAAAAAQPSGSEGRGVEGTWYVQVVPTICATGAPIPGVSPVQALVTFHAGGSLSETAGGTGFAPGQRSPGHGTWRHDAGQTFTQRFTALINFTTVPGFQEAGWQVVTQSVELIDRDTLASSGRNAFYRTDGTLYRTGCSTATGKRFE
ncbi:hypothetical protein TBR22_A48540 [Luteitalea sp. TBR-22]|uniref:hypothetical protein n=1 Tax=Luteitalea sp. TBR-22 TaxID=2802971 RepID=UPI001AFA93A5|nr:hypothetical protein [Luteitalea sp. TBR-22]BCS35620.1 hypothetical protein TBR22_A48540 [Luteitalea sp. TBR-22]